MRNGLALIVGSAAVISFGIAAYGTDRSHERHVARIAAQERSQAMTAVQRQAHAPLPDTDLVAADEVARAAYLRSERTRIERETQEWRNWRDLQDVAARRTEARERRAVQVLFED